MEFINNEVTEAHGDISQIGFNLDSLQMMVYGLDGKIGSLVTKHNFTLKERVICLHCDYSEAGML